MTVFSINTHSKRKKALMTLQSWSLCQTVALLVLGYCPHHVSLLGAQIAWTLNLPLPLPPLPLCRSVRASSPAQCFFKKQIRWEWWVWRNGSSDGGGDSSGAQAVVGSSGRFSRGSDGGDGSGGVGSYPEEAAWSGGSPCLRHSVITALLLNILLIYY